MPENDLNVMDIRSVFEQVRRKGVTQRVGRDSTLYPRCGGICFQYLPKALARHTFAGDINKERVFIARVDKDRTGFFDISV